MTEEKKDIGKSQKQALRQWLTTGRTLTEALPFILRYDGKTVVIKYGGHAMGDKRLAQDFARDIVLIKQVGPNPVVVHGGGPQIAKLLDRLKITSSFVDGLRVTDEATVEVVEMVLSGSINKKLVTDINHAGGTAVGLSGKDGNLMIAKKLERKKKDPDSHIEKVLDLGFVGEPDEMNPNVLETILASDLIPIVAPIGVGRSGETYNVNADTAAGAVAGAMGAMRLLLLTDVAGVLDANGELIPRLTISAARDLIQNGTIAGGMIPKIETCIGAIEQGVEGVVILDGRVPHAVLLELFTDQGAGTLIEPDS
jgi:acetylglutamate kinase